MNTHKALTAYHGRRDYPTIAQEAAAYMRANPRTSEFALLKWAATSFGEGSNKLTMMQQAASVETWGKIIDDYGDGLIDHTAVDQMRTAMKLPVAVRGALMPDAHKGYALPIGGVAVLADAVSPSFVGYDISCMMYLSVYNVPISYFMEWREAWARELLAVTSFGLGAETPQGQGHWGHPVMDDPRWNSTAVLKRLKPLAQKQLGSSGGGNHFADMMELHWQDGRQEVALLTHSGSRGTGYKLATHYVALAAQETKAVAQGIPSGYEWLDTRSESGQEYLAAMELMGEYALANHTCIHAAFAKAIGIRPGWTLWNRHNYAWVESEGVVHRKGATPAGKDVKGVIPGSSGRNSYVVRGKGNPLAINSASHGAGRPFSRSDAKRYHDGAFVNEWMQAHNILTFGLEPDETLLAYKDIDEVMAAQQDLIEIEATLVPRVVVMGGASDDGD